MTDLRTAAQQALEALSLALSDVEWRINSPTQRVIHKGYNALRAALAQQDEPARGWVSMDEYKRLQGLVTSQGIRLMEYESKQPQQAEPVEPVARDVTKNGRVIYDDASKDDSLLRVSGDFEDDEQRVRYVKRIVDKLNAAPPQQADPTDPGRDVDVLREHVRHLERRVRELHAQQAEPDHETRAELAEQQVVQLAEERDHYRNLWQKAQQTEPAQEPAFHGFMSDDGTQVDVCFSPSAPRRDGTYATAYYTAPPHRVAQQAEPVQEPVGPVAWMVYIEGGASAYVTDNPRDLIGAYRALPLYTAPPRRTMVPLTEGEIDALPWFGSPRQFARAVEKASWEKNHGQA